MDSDTCKDGLHGTVGEALEEEAGALRAAEVRRARLRVAILAGATVGAVAVASAPAGLTTVSSMVI